MSGQPVALASENEPRLPLEPQPGDMHGVGIIVAREAELALEDEVNQKRSEARCEQHKAPAPKIDVSRRFSALRIDHKKTGGDDRRRTYDRQLRQGRRDGQHDD